MLSDKERNEIIKKHTALGFCDSESACKEVERAALAKASQQVQGEPCGLLDVISAGKAHFSYYGYMEPGTYCVYPGPKAPHSSDALKAMPAPKQEPVGKIISWINSSTAIVSGEGMNALCDGAVLYDHPPPSQAAAIPENFVEAFDHIIELLEYVPDRPVIYPESTDNTLLRTIKSIVTKLRSLSAAPKPE